MKLNINHQAENELLTIMKKLNINSPSHAANVLISKVYKMLTQPNCEVINESAGKPKEH